MHEYGDPIKGEVHAADASTATAVPIYNVGSLTARTLNAAEYINVRSITVVTNTAADVHVFIGADGTPGAGETIMRGTFPASGGAAQANVDVAGGKGHTIWVKSSVAAIVDVNLKGDVHREENAKRPTWRESLVPGA